MTRSLVVLGTALLVAGCGEGASAKAQSGDASAAVAGSGTDVSAVAAGSVTETPLPTTPISFADAMGRTPPSIRETVPCPFLSDETALAAATSPYEIIRRSVSNEECVWNYNIGFAIKARVEPLAGSRPFAERQYNMDAKPILEPQASPGQNAVLLYDTAWEEPRPFAFGFDLGDKRVFLNITGMRTSLAQLQPAAEEIAAKLPTAPRIEPQFREEVGAYDLCSTWVEAGLLSLFGLPEGTPVSITPSGTSCIFEMRVPESPSRNVITLGLSVFEEAPNAFEFLKEKGWTEVPGYDHRVLSHNTTDEWGVHTELRGLIQDGSVVVTITDKDGGKEDATKRLFDNVMARIVP